MTVQELINELEKVKNKNLQIVVEELIRLIGFTIMK
jgi:hypothetical protein